MSIRNQETGEKDTLIQNICPSSHVKCWKHRPFSRPHMKLCHYWWLYDAEHGSTDFQSCPSIICCHFKEGEHNKKMLTLCCCHVASRWLIKIGLLNCSTPYIFYLTSHLIKKYDEKNYWTWNSPCLLVLSS